jgi:hypothetical protein
VPRNGEIRGGHERRGELTQEYITGRLLKVGILAEKNGRESLISLCIQYLDLTDLPSLLRLIHLPNSCCTVKYNI